MFGITVSKIIIVTVCYSTGGAVFDLFSVDDNDARACICRRTGVISLYVYGRSNRLVLRLTSWTDQCMATLHNRNVTASNTACTYIP